MRRRPRIKKPFVEKADTMTEPKVPSVAAERDAGLCPQDRVRITLAEGEVSKISIRYPIEKPGVEESVHRAMDQRTHALNDTIFYIEQGPNSWEATADDLLEVAREKQADFAIATALARGAVAEGMVDDLNYGLFRVQEELEK